MGLSYNFSRRFSRLLLKNRALFIGLFALIFMSALCAPPQISRHVWGLDYIIDTLARMDQLLLDKRFEWRGMQPPDSRIVIIGVDDITPQRNNFKEKDLENSEALRLMTERDYPWNRKVWAILVQKLMDAGVRTVAFDLIFAREMEGDPDFKAVLEKYSDRIVLASTKVEETDGSRVYLSFLHPNPGILPSQTATIDGFAFYTADADKVIRRVTYRTSKMTEQGFPGYGPNDMLSLAATTALISAGIQAPDQPQIPINFQGRSGTYTTLPLAELFIDSTYLSDPRYRGGATLKDKIVFVGPTAELFHDRVNTPFGEMDGVEVHAQATADLLSGRGLKETGKTFYILMPLCLMLAAGLIVLLVRQAAIQIGLLVGITAAFGFAAHTLFSQYHTVIPMAAPLAAVLSMGSFGVVYNLIAEQLKGASVRSVLDKYVSKNVANVIIASNESFDHAMRGERKSVTALFSDIRGFTSSFETADPQELVDQLNEYFLEMVDAVNNQDGTLQKFIGDAIMAVWGDTHSNGLATDAAGAVRTALLMRSALVRLNQRWHGQQGRIQIAIGIGLNHGDVVVGNLGHPQRMEFTVLGDAVNLAARLESATKQFHCDMLAGEKVEELTRDLFVFRRVDKLRVKGKNLPVSVFIPLSLASVAPPPWLAAYHQAIDLYRARKFTEAIALFKEVDRQIGGDDFLCGMYIDRCTLFTTEPPAADWDGSHTLSDK